MTLALIDGDIVAFRAAAANCKEFNFGDGVVGSTNNPEAAAAAAVDNVASWASMAKCRDIIVCFTGPKNFRKVILPTYKANRTKAKPPVFAATVEAVRDRFETRMVNGLEADDLLGILLTTPKYNGAVCCTLDKDLRTIPGRHFNPTKDYKPVAVSENAADYWWLMQTMMGDTCDGYCGIPKIGPKKAADILGPAGPRAGWAHLWPKVVAAFRAAKLTEQDALVMARVARILRRSDYDRDTKEVVLWHPIKPERLKLETVCGA